MKDLFKASFAICMGWNCGEFVSLFIATALRKLCNHTHNTDKTPETKHTQQVETHKKFDKEILGFRAD